MTTTITITIENDDNHTNYTHDDDDDNDDEEGDDGKTNKVPKAVWKSNMNYHRPQPSVNV